MRGSFRRWLLVATIVVSAAIAMLGLTLAIGLAHADRLLDRSGRSRDQLALAYRLEAGSIGLMAPDAALRRQSAAALDGDLARYRASIAAETGKLGSSTRAGQAIEAARADRLVRLLEPMKNEAGPQLADDAVRVRTIVHAIVLRETGEANAALAEMRALRRRATLLAIALPLAVTILGGWFFRAIRNGLVQPLAQLRRAAAAIGSGDAEACGPGFTDFAPLAAAVMQADREIVRQRTALAEINRGLEAQVAERTATLAGQNERLAAIDDTRRTFFSRVGHELRTPITVIRGEAEVVLRDPDADVARLRDALGYIVVAGNLLGRRIDDLLTVARAEDGRPTIIRERVDLAGIVRAAASIAASYAASGGVTLDMDLPHAPLPVEGDASWLQQALIALVDNAVRHAAGRGGGGRIRLAVRSVDGMTIATVADNGPGAPPDLLPRLFEDWSQGDRASGGSGLGMAVAKWVATVHRGTIDAINAPEGGLIVTLRLPPA